MAVSQIAWLRSLLPPRASVSQRERLRAGGGALLGIALTGLVSAVLLGSANAIIDAANSDERVDGLVGLAVAGIVLAAGMWWIYFVIPSAEVLHARRER